MGWPAFCFEEWNLSQENKTGDKAFQQMLCYQNPFRNDHQQQSVASRPGTLGWFTIRLIILMETNLPSVHSGNGSALLQELQCVSQFLLWMVSSLPYSEKADLFSRSSPGVFALSASRPVVAKVHSSHVRRLRVIVSTLCAKHTI